MEVGDNMKLFNILKEICYRLNLIADYVVEQGISGNWTYRKWNSGVSECWGRHSVTLNVNISWGGTYYGVASAIAFPSGLFKSNPKAEFQVENGNLWLATYAPVASATDAIYLISSAINNNCHAYIVIHAKGEWK